MKKTKIEAFNLIGISVRTTNENGQAAKDIPLLWSKFFSENIPEKIVNKTSSDIYCIYTDYVKDHTQPYTTILGFKVENLDNIPKGMIGKPISAGNYTPFIAQGKITDGIVYNEWLKIWNAPIDRAFTADFEIYGQRSQDPENAEVEILIALK
ncbi:MAG: effector binding domain-containing protein [Bacteroidetes bacterium]|nr:effector binding domain-containing protein [Bacteroidota bacterium]